MLDNSMKSILQINDSYKQFFETLFNKYTGLAHFHQCMYIYDNKPRLINRMVSRFRSNDLANEIFLPT